MAKSGVHEEIIRVRLASIPHPGLVKITALGEQNCFFHSVLRAFNRYYIEAKSWNDRRSMARIVRNNLADALGEKDARGIVYYDTLSRGTLRNFSKYYPRVKLEALQAELRSDSPVDNVYHEIMSELLNKDIYFVDMQTGDVYLTSSDLDLLYKGRQSICIAVIQSKRSKDTEMMKDPVDHFDVLGVEGEDGIIYTLFEPRHPLIRMLQDRQRARLSGKVCLRQTETLPLPDG